jgi:hypothetical protein
MPTFRRLLVGLLLAGATGRAQPSLPPAPATPPLDPSASDPISAPRRTADQLGQLLAPIALYPDALIALILPAATAPADIVLAARQWRDTGGDRSQVEHRAWDESVKSLTYYPDVLQWMDENLEWTKQVGEAFLEQPAEVMQAVQRLRAQARAAGTLVDTPQQLVIAEPEVIRIVPAQPETIYVPYYEPALVFLPEPVWYGSPRVTFGVGLAVGSWLAFECDWRRHTIWVGDRHRHWSGHDWRRPVVPFPTFGPGYARQPGVRPWRPPPPSLRPPRTHPYRPTTEILRPGPATSPLARHSPVPPAGPSAHRPVPAPAFPRRSTPPPVSTSERSVPRYAHGSAGAAAEAGPNRPGVTVTPGTPTAATRRNPSERRPATAPESTVASPSRRSVPPEARATPASTPTRPQVSPPDSAPRHSVNPHRPSRSSPPTGLSAPGSPSTQTRPATPPATASTAAPVPAPARREGEGERSVGRRPANEQNQR